MTDRELMQQALEALDGLSEPYDVLRIQTALRERLAREEEIEPPMALVLADVLEQRHAIDGCNAEMQAAAELRRLHGLLFGGEWVGLTEQDFSAINQSSLTKLQAATCAESILKEKNA
jgi:hypothetical protein